MGKILCTLLLALFASLPAMVFAGDYVIGEGDGLDVSVWGVKELNVSVKVRPDGKITIPGIGDVTASGFTPQELQADLATRLKDLVKNPIVTVSVKEIINSKVYIFGGGINSGVYDLNRRTTLLQLLCVIGNGQGAAASVPGAAAIGGMAKVADYKKAYVLRKGKIIKENLYNLFVKGDTSEDIMMETGDAIFVPQLLERNVYVLGEVNSPKFIEYREGMTVMEALLEAGGFTKFAKQNDTTILRKEGGKDVSLTVKAKDLIKDRDLSQNVRLKPGDYVIVKESMF
jgi:polysaccharide export outer membrane protein